MVDGNWPEAERRPFSYRPKHTIVTIPLKTVVAVSITRRFYLSIVRVVVGYLPSCTRDVLSYVRTVYDAEIRANKRFRLVRRFLPLRSRLAIISVVFFTYIARGRYKDDGYTYLNNGTRSTPVTTEIEASSRVSIVSLTRTKPGVRVVKPLPPFTHHQTLCK